LKEIVNLIPMAGEGKRFKDAGFLVPKPLIKVDGLPMVVKALEALPKASKNILIVRKDQIDINVLKLLLDEYFKNIVIIEIESLTEGQASTCLLAENYFDRDSILNVGACDIGFKYDPNEYFQMINNSESFIWAYNNNQNVIKNPEMYGWIKLKDNSNEIDYVSCKKPISSNLLEDHVISGTFTFKSSNLFFKAIKKMIKSNDRINGEFYLDTIFNHLPNKSHIFKVAEYYSWGTPDELLNYKNEI
jgi:dTDP-glucose pyrophosphorylase